jgi:23S rRNA pseudouridine1911/1915/1917 synthase
MSYNRFPLILLYEDNHLFIMNKPCGLATQPEPYSDISLESQAKQYIKVRDKKPGNVFLHAIHRLDKPVSGIVVFGKTQKALSRMNEAIRQRICKKIYQAIVHGHLPHSHGSIEIFLSHGDKKAHVTKASDKSAKLSTLDFIVRRQARDFSLIEITLHTGRYHQIRASFAMHGNPIVGDQKYGSPIILEQNAIALHHANFECIHPVTGISLHITAPPPDFWERVIP